MLTVKIVHAVLHILALVFIVIGMKAVFDAHYMNNYTNMYTLHSWIGLSAVVLFGIQVMLSSEVLSI